MAISNTRQERLFAKKETTFGTAVTLAGSDYIRHTQCTLKGNQGDIPSTDKTGSFSAQIGASGSRIGQWSIVAEARPSGVAGTEPDLGPIFECTMGGAPQITASTSVNYPLSSTIKSFTLGRYRQPSGVMQQIGIGCLVNSLDFSFGLNENCKFSLAGPCLWVPDSITFADLDATGKGGLVSFPAEPSTPVSAGSPVSGLTGTALIDGSSALSVTNCSIKLNTAIELPNDRLFNGRYPSAPERGTISATIDLKIVDEDQSYVTGLYPKALARTPVDISIRAGVVGGNAVYWVFQNCLLPQPDFDESARKWAANMSGITCYPDSAGSLDEISLWFD